MQPSQKQISQYRRLGTLTIEGDTLEKNKTAENLIDAIGDSRDVLMRATSVWPLTIFPHTVSIDRSKLTITHRGFFNSAEVLSISIEDILNITATVGPFFGFIHISTRFFDSDKQYSVGNFKRSDVLKLKRILQGSIIAKQKGVDCTALTTRELAKMLDDLGKVAPQEKV